MGLKGCSNRVKRWSRGAAGGAGQRGGKQAAGGLCARGTGCNGGGVEWLQEGRRLAREVAGLQAGGQLSRYRLLGGIVQGGSVQRASGESSHEQRVCTQCAARPQCCAPSSHLPQRGLHKIGGGRRPAGGRHQPEEATRARALPRPPHLEHQKDPARGKAGPLGNGRCVRTWASWA